MIGDAIRRFIEVGLVGAIVFGLTASGDEAGWAVDEGSRTLLFPTALEWRSVDSNEALSRAVIGHRAAPTVFDGGESITATVLGPHRGPVRLSLPRWTEARPSGRRLYGLARFYNEPRPLSFSNGTLWTIGDDETIVLDANAWVGWKDRMSAVLVSAPSAVAALGKDELLFDWKDQADVAVRAVSVGHVGGSNGPSFGELRYAHLWDWLAAFCRTIESILSGLHGLLGSWGWAIIMLALLTRLLLLPVNLLAVKFQREVSGHQAVLEPKLQRIKQQFDGEEAHNRIMDEYRALGISPFHTLKPMVGALAQLPILVAVFNVLGEFPGLQGQSFAWIQDLAYPDTVATLPVFVPNFADQVNLLPIIMTVIALIATISFRNRLATTKEIAGEKRKLYLMAAVFFVLFYPFPAAMVLYWTTANVLQLLQQQVVKI